MYELDLYVARVYGMICASICMHDLFLETCLDRSNLVHALALAMNTTKPCIEEFIQTKRTTIHKAIQSMTQMETTPVLRLTNLESQNKTTLLSGIILMFVDMYLNDTSANMDLCQREWNTYATYNESFKDPSKQVNYVCAELHAFLRPLRTQVHTLAMAACTSLESTHPDVVRSTHRILLQHHTHITCAYVNKGLTMLASDP